MKMKTQQPKTYEIISKSSAKVKVHSNTSLPQETREASNKQRSFTHKTTRKRKKKNPKVSRRKETVKIRAEITEKKPRR